MNKQDWEKRFDELRTIFTERYNAEFDDGGDSEYRKRRYAVDGARIHGYNSAVSDMSGIVAAELSALKEAHRKQIDRSKADGKIDLLRLLQLKVCLFSKEEIQEFVDRTLNDYESAIRKLGDTPIKEEK